MSRHAALRSLLAGVALSAVAFGACTNGPTPPPRDGGFFVLADAAPYNPNDPWGLNGMGGAAGGTTGGTGGSTGQVRVDAGKGRGEEERDPEKTGDAGTLPPCPAGTFDGSRCPTEDLRCALPPGDGSAALICKCKGGDDDREWECERP